ncbi:MAG: putative methylase [Patescibacteria group bacterium]|nr:putative methylase [Patescibacteria group bacterium]
MNTYLLTVFPGLAGLAGEELLARTGLKSTGVKRVRDREVMQVRSEASRPLLDVRLVEDMFVLLGKVSLTGQTADLKALGASPAFRGGLAKAVAERGPQASKSRFRVVVQADDARWRLYRRVDTQAAAEAAIARAHPGWRLDREEAPVEIWLHQVGREALVSLRLTTNAHRQRGGREQERTAALRPTIAAALVYLSVPADDDVFLDPMCGTGTVLLERARAGRYGLLLGGDNDAAAVKAALANFGPRHQPRRIERWDARHLPLEDASVDALATNLPWGRQIGRPEDLPALYRDVLAEVARVLRPGGRAVLLSSEWELLKRLIKAQSRLKQERTISNIDVLGRRADIVVLTRS